MGMQAKAVIGRELNQPVTVETVEVESPREGEVMVKIGACGVCHSDLSATHTVNPGRDGDAVAKILELTGGGADYGFECIGLPVTIEQTDNAVGRGGTAVVVGVTKVTDTITLGSFLIPFTEKVLAGSVYGSCRPRVDFPRLLSLYKSNRLKLDELVTATYSIEEAPRAFEDMVNGVNARGVIVF